MILILFPPSPQAVVLGEQIAELQGSMAEAEQLRSVEKKTNLAKIKDAADAQAAVTQAVTVLREFYAKSGVAFFLQENSKSQQRRRNLPEAFFQEENSQPEAFAGDYQAGAGSSGVMGLLEVVQSDFARLEAETKAAEDEAEAQHSAFVTDSKVSKTQMEADLEHANSSKQREQAALQTSVMDLDGTQKELDAAMDYFEKLKPSCIDTGVSHEERAARREEEIDSLKEALKILNGEAVL